MRRLIPLLVSVCLASASYADEPSFPVTCDEAVERLLTGLPKAEKERLAKYKKADLILLHHGFGTGIRNEFGLWADNKALAKSCTGRRRAHPDDVSMIIIEKTWEALQ